ncbi:hypothetical protein D770_13550 [Flammeovirgaceae bacterium 311]|nr:hypothetical protein D770_13550 [Flammeovirgaceae bacterium 311]
MPGGGSNTEAANKWLHFGYCLLQWFFSIKSIKLLLPEIFFPLIRIYFFYSMNVRQSIYLLLISGLLLMASAMPALGQVSFGLRLTSGAQISYFQAWNHHSVGTYTRMGLGAFMRVPLKEKVVLQPELNYLTYPSASLESHTISLPILLTFRISSDIEIEAGPSLLRDFRFGNSSDVNPYLNVGANTGINFWFSKHWSGNVRFTYELIRRTIDDYLPADYEDPLLKTEGPEPGYRDMLLTTSVRYTFR